MVFDRAIIGISPFSQSPVIDGRTAHQATWPMNCAAIVGADRVLDAHSDLLVYECDAFVIEKHCPERGRVSADDGRSGRAS